MSLELQVQEPFIEVAVFTAITVISILSIQLIKKRNIKAGITGNDINKKDKPLIPESLGIALLIPIMAGGVFAFIFYKWWTIEFIAWFILLGIFALMGFLDDTKNKYVSKTIPWPLRALPIAVISIIFSYIFSFNLLWLIPFALFIAGIAGFQNTFAGLNGLEVGNGFIVSIFAMYLLWNTEMRLLAIILSASILGLLLFNKYPAKAFPGDSGTLLIGSALASLFVMKGNLEFVVIAFLFYLPHMLDFALKIITNKKDMSQQEVKPYKLLENNKLDFNDPEKKRHDFAKLIIRLFGPMKEWKIVLVLWLIVILNGIGIIFLFGKF